MKTSFKTFNKKEVYQKLQYLITDTSLLVRKNLELLGENIDTINSKRNTTINYRSADLSKTEVPQQEKNSLQTFLLKNYSYIGNSSFSKNSNGIKSFLPHGSTDKIIEILFDQIALTAQSWSKQNIIGESRFANIAQMSEIERHNLARQVANQNRALATLGGTTNFLGLSGLFVDSLWLLIVSLRTINQLAEIYGQPLIGKEGIRIAYTMLANCELHNIQEKQILLASLAIVSRGLINTETKGLKHALEMEMNTQENVTEFVNYIDDLLTKSNIDIDKFNLSWLGKSLPLIATAAGFHYNSLLIEEVIGVANATFAPEIRVVGIEKPL